MAGESPERIDPLFQPLFARVFGRKGESEGVARAFISAVFSRVGLGECGPIDDISAEHSFAEGSVRCRMPAVDVRIVAGPRIVDLEAQRYPVDYERKALMYASHLMVEGLQRGGGLEAMPQVVVIMLVAGELVFPEAQGAVSTCRRQWADERGAPLRAGTDREVFVLVELEKVRRRYNSLEGGVLDDELLAWLYLLAGGYANAEEVEAMEERFPTIEEFAQLYGIAIDDPAIAGRYRQLANEVTEYKSVVECATSRGREQGLRQGLEQGRSEGLEQGIEQGLEQGREEMVCAMRASGMTQEQIDLVLEAAASAG